MQSQWQLPNFSLRWLTHKSVFGQSLLSKACTLSYAAHAVQLTAAPRRNLPCRSNQLARGSQWTRSNSHICLEWNCGKPICTSPPCLYQTHRQLQKPGLRLLANGGVNALFNFLTSCSIPQKTSSNLLRSTASSFPRQKEELLHKSPAMCSAATRQTCPNNAASRKIVPAWFQNHRPGSIGTSVRRLASSPLRRRTAYRCKKICLLGASGQDTHAQHRARAQTRPNFNGTSGSFATFRQDFATYCGQLVRNFFTLHGLLLHGKKKQSTRTQGLW